MAFKVIQDFKKRTRWRENSLIFRQVRARQRLSYCELAKSSTKAVKNVFYQ